MPAVSELTAVYSNFMLNPRPGPDVCRACFNLTKGFARCYACAHCESWLAVMAPISYSVAGGQLHHALAHYKRAGGTASRRLTVELAAVLWRYLVAHESCLARRAGVPSFGIVTTVPSSTRERSAPHPLRHIVESLVGPTRARHQPLLRRSAAEVPAHVFDADRYEVLGRLGGDAVLLIDDTWTTGANAQSAAAALRGAGAGSVAAVVIGRHVRGNWHRNGLRLRGIKRPFDWSGCVWHHEPATDAIGG